FLGLAMATIANPIESSSALEARTTIDATVTCSTDVAFEGNGPKLYRYLCLHVFKREHSEPPQEADGEYIGGCINCPRGNVQTALADCLYIENH
ncbi:hypothetical protein COCVIDRAFT_104293, partial [Bipolaris victoriae FI3]